MTRIPNQFHKNRFSPLSRGETPPPNLVLQVPFPPLRSVVLRSQKEGVLGKKLPGDGVDREKKEKKKAQKKDDVVANGRGVKDAAFLLTIGSFLLMVELFYLQLCLGPFFAYNLRFLAYICSFFTYNWSFFLLAVGGKCV